MKQEYYKRHLIKAYLDDAEYERFTSIARRSNTTNSQLVRDMLQEAVFIEFPSVDFRQALSELVHIGINMNQLAMRSHSLGFIDRQEYEKNAKEALDAISKFHRLYIQCSTQIEEEKEIRKKSVITYDKRNEYCKRDFGKADRRGEKDCHRQHTHGQAASI